MALEHLNFVLFHQELHPLAHPVGYLPAAGDHGVEILIGFPDLQAILFRMLQVVEYLGRFQQGLGGDTPPVQANPSQAFLFYDGGFQPQLGGADRCYIPPRATP